MHRVIKSFALLAVCCLGITACESANPPGTTSTESALAGNTCYTSIPPYSGLLPQSATYAGMWNEHVYCTHVPTSMTPDFYPSFTGPCTPDASGHQIPGEYQIDVWVENSSSDSPRQYKCARLSIPAGGLHYDFHNVLERGWLATYPVPQKTWVVQALYVGPGLTAIASGLPDVYASGCTGPSTNCVSVVNWRGGSAFWMQADTYVAMASMYTYRIGYAP